jgi:hypothetical protein
MTIEARPAYLRCVKVAATAPFTKGTAYEVSHYDEEGSPVVACDDGYKVVKLPIAGCRFEPYDLWRNYRSAEL